MNIHLLKVRKLIISSMISLTGLLLMLFIISFLPNSSIDLKKIITFGVLLPLLLVVIIGIAYFGKKFTTVQQSFVSENYDIIKGILGDEVRYHANGMIPFQVIETDPSVTAEQANSCKSTHMLSGTYRGIDFTATNLVTFQSRGYATVDHSIFDGYYILFNVRAPHAKPLYACTNDFWSDFHVKGPLSFTIKKGRKLYEVHSSSSYKLVASDNINLNASSKRALEQIFTETNRPIALNFYENGKIGMAIRTYKAFTFATGPQQSLVTDPQLVRRIIKHDVREIKLHLDKVVGLLSK